MLRVEAGTDAFVPFVPFVPFVQVSGFFRLVSFLLSV